MINENKIGEIAMVIIPAIGSLSLGIVIGWLVRYFIRRYSSFGPKALSSTISILAGGGVLKYFDPNANIIWFYPIGLLIGFIIYTVIAIWELGRLNPSPAQEKNKGFVSSSDDDDDDSDKGGSSGSLPPDHPYLDPPDLPGSDGPLGFPGPGKHEF